MNAHALSVLSYDQVRDRVADHCLTEFGRSCACTLAPFRDRADAERRLDLCEDISRFLSVSRLPDIVCDDIRPSLEKLRMADAVLPRIELFRLFRTLRGMVALRSSFGTETPPHGALADLAASVRPLSQLMSSFYGVFDDAGEIRDDASEGLRSVRAAMSEVRVRIRKRAASFARQDANARMLEDREPLVWEQRTVFLVRNSSRRGLRGIVHSSSASGHSVYFEPEEFVEDNNELAALVSSEEDEILKILARLSGLAAEHSGDILHDMERMAAFDAACAAVRWSESVPGAVFIRPAFDSDGLEILKARHPLIPSCVPVDIRIAEPGRVLVISGPNTGGKSAALKTAGLLSALAMTGWPVPAAFCRIGWFDDVFVDLGDEQSLERALSTFSAHLVNVRSLRAAVTPHSLVLMDEPGAGTEPESGEAFAEVLLKELAERGCLAIVTTHFKRVKLLALSDPSFRNAAVDFDPADGAPRYNLLYGVPGDSRPLDAMRRIGFPEAFLGKISGILGPGRQELSSVIAGLSEEKRRLESARLDCESRTAEAEIRTVEADRRQKEFDAREKVFKKEFRKQIKEFLSVSRQKFEALVREMVESGKPGQFTQQGKRFFDELELQAATESDALPSDRILSPGDRVLVRGKHEAVVESVRDGKAVVQTVNGRATIPVSDCIPVAASKAGPVRPATTGRSAVEIASVSSVRITGPKLELNIIGLRREEAEVRLRDFFDSALLSGVPFVRIVHGKGTGSLREMTRGFFEERKSSGEVRSYASAPPEAGGDGCTIAEI